MRNFRREGELGIITTKWRVQHKYNRIVFELSGVDSLANDPEVTVTYYRTLDPLMTDSTGQNYLPALADHRHALGQELHPHVQGKNRQWRAHYRAGAGILAAGDGRLRRHAAAAVP